MIVTGNPLLMGASGKLGNVVVKQYEGKTVLTAVPDMSNRKLSEKQQDANERMQFAIISAKAIVANPAQKQRACEMLQVTPNRVFRAIVKQFLLTNGNDALFEETEQEKRDKQTLAALQSIIRAGIPDAEIQLFGDRAKGTHSKQSDWDLLVLTVSDHPQAMKWELQDQLFNCTMQQGTRVNLLLVQQEKWQTGKEYELLRKRVAAHSIPVA